MHILESIAVRCNKIIEQRLYEKALRENSTRVSSKRYWLCRSCRSLQTIVRYFDNCVSFSATCLKDFSRSAYCGFPNDRPRIEKKMVWAFVLNLLECTTVKVHLRIQFQSKYSCAFGSAQDGINKSLLITFIIYWVKNVHPTLWTLRLVFIFQQNN